MALGQNVKLRREALKITQSALAETVGMSQAALSALERRDSKTSEFLIEIAAALGASPTELLTGEVCASPPNETLDLIASASIEIEKLTVALTIASARLAALIDVSNLSHKKNGRIVDLNKDSHLEDSFSINIKSPFLPDNSTQIINNKKDKKPG